MIGNDADTSNECRRHIQFLDAATGAAGTRS
jgi:hypothetical protein